MLHRIAIIRRSLQGSVFRAQFRALTSGKNGDDGNTPPPSSDFEDEFEDMSFSVVADDAEEIPINVDEAPEDAGEITPELASELVTRMVASVTEKPPGSSQMSRTAVSRITPHTIEVLRASRITTNEVVAPGAEIEDYPINRKVVAEIDIERLNLSVPAAEALRILAGSRYKGDHVIIGCDSFRTSEENQAHAVSRLDGLVRAAKEAVGDVVDSRELGSWDEVVQEVSSQSSSNEREHASLSFLLDKRDPRSETFVASVSQIMT